jgi:hypothetical protein
MHSLTHMSLRGGSGNRHRVCIKGRWGILGPTSWRHMPCADAPPKKEGESHAARHPVDRLLWAVFDLQHRNSVPLLRRLQPCCWEVRKTWDQSLGSVGNKLGSNHIVGNKLGSNYIENDPNCLKMIPIVWKNNIRIQNNRLPSSCALLL